MISLLKRLIVALLLLPAACGGGGSGGPSETPVQPPPPASAPGALQVTLLRGPGTPLRLFSARVRATGPNPAESRLREDETWVRTDLAPEEFEVAVDDLTPDCAFTGTTIRRVTVPSGGVATLEFVVECSFLPEERIVYNTLSPDNVSADVFSARPDGSDQRRLTDQAPGLGFPAWSPDGARILYEDFVPGGRREVWIMNHDGTEATSVGRGGRPAWSPNGKRVAYEFGDDLFVADLEGRALRSSVNLTGDGRAVDDEGPSWSPDGTTIAFHRGDVVHLVGPDGSELRALVPGVGAVWMADGSRLVFASTEVGQIASIRPDGTDVRILSLQDGGAGHPDPSPDGDRIAFHSPTLDPRARIWIMNADGTGPRVIEAIPSGAEHPNWGPP